MRTMLTLLMATAAMISGAYAIAPTTGDGLGADTSVSGVSRLADRLGIPGAAVQVLSREAVLERSLVGVDGRGDPVDSRTPFVWGSVSKSFTAATVSALASRGLLDLGDRIEQVLPEADSVGLAPGVTVDDLVHHTSGLPHQVSTLDDWTRTGTALDAVPGLEVETSEPGRFRYSSLNYLLLQAITEKVTGEPFREVVSRETSIDVDDGPIPAGHVPFFTFPKAIEVGVDAAGLGYGYLSGSIDQLGRYAQRQLADLASTAPEAVNRRTDTVPTGSGMEYGYGWYVERLSDGTEMRWHSGAVPGFFTHIALIPDRDLALVLVANRYGELEADRFASAARALVAAQLGLDSPTDIARGPGLYEMVLVAACITVAALAFCFVRALRFRSGAGRRVWPGILACLGSGAALYFGIPIIAGAPVSVIGRWAPDIALLLWIALAGLALITAALTLRRVRA